MADLSRVGEKECQRLVATSTGASFREVAKVVKEAIKEPKEGEVLIKLTHAGINGGCETFRSRGEFWFAGNKAKDEFELGAEGSGTIVKVGEGVENLKVGDHVACSLVSAFCEYGVTNARFCIKVAEAGPEAVALMISGLVAYCAIKVTGNVQPGEVVLITAAAGGTGHFAVQFAQMLGARVVATCGGKHKAEKLATLGIERIINHHKEDVGSVLKREYPNGVDMVYEGVGGSMMQAALDNLAPCGRLLTVGYISQYPHNSNIEPEAPLGHDLPSSQDLFWKGLTVKRGEQTIMGNVWPADPMAIQECRREVFRLYGEGKVQAWVDDSKKFKGVASIPDAVDHMLQGRHIGKVVVEI